MLLAVAGADAGGRDDRLVVGLAAAGGEIDFARRRADALRHGLTRLLQRFLGLLAEGVQTRGVAVILKQIGEHRVNGGAADTGGGSVVCIYKHRQVSFLL